MLKVCCTNRNREQRCHKTIVTSQRQANEEFASRPPMIALKESERKLFEFLISVANNAGKGTVLRVAGGWVRDKVRKAVAAQIRARFRHADVDVADATRFK